MSFLDRIIQRFQREQRRSAPPPVRFYDRRTPRQAKAIARRRRRNKIAKASRKRNRTR